VVTELPSPSSGVCYVLQEDPELAEAIEPALRPHAVETLTAQEWRVPAGTWQPQRPPGLERGFGLLVLGGVMIHRIGVEERFSAELIGEGDVLRRPPVDGESPLSITSDWIVLEPTRLAILDEHFVRELADFPQLAGRLVARAVARSRQLGVNMAIVHQARVDVRLHMLLWHLAARWGRVRRDGVVVPLRLTHTVLSDLVAARRPTVTSALAELGKRGEVRAVDEGWLLSGDPPAHLSAGLASGPPA
jgi:CRP-like cAMP-binding protein